MKTKTLTATAYPPPPPQSSPKKDSRRLLVVALLIVIIIVSAGVLFYLATNQSSTNPTPTPSATPTATPTSSPTAIPTPTPTSTPSGNNQNANFRAGTWANYTVTTYSDGEDASESLMNYAVDEGTYKGAACWLLKIETLTTEDTSTMRTLTTYWINKNTLEAIHLKTQGYINGELIYDDEDDISPSDAGDMPETIDMNTVTTYETITVPAGTFYCGKITVTSAAGTTSTWANSDIPVVGLVKMETTSGGVVTSTIVLTSYGG